jgi:MFS family permease
MVAQGIPNGTLDSRGAPRYKPVVRLLRLRDLRIVLLVYALSSLGDYLALITLTLRVKDLTESGLAVSGLLLAGLVPLVLLAPLGGWLVDRFETVRTLALASLGQAAIALGLVFADAYWAILVLAFLLSSGFAITQPGVFALTPRIVGEEGTTEANAYLEVSRWSGATLGPLAAGWITHAWGAGTALSANAVTFLVVAAALPLLRVRRPLDTSEEGEEMGPSPVRAGLRFLRRDRLLRLVIGAITVMVVFAAIDNVAEVFYAKDVLGAGDVGYGGLVTAWTAGMVIGATVIGRRLRTERLALSVLVAALVGGGAIALAAMVPVLGLALGTFVVGGVANGVELVGLRSLIHKRVPDRLRGRVFALYYGAVNAAQITAMGLGGVAVVGLGARGSLLLGGVGTILVGAVGLALLVPIRRAEEDAAAYSTRLS